MTSNLGRFEDTHPDFTINPEVPPLGDLVHFYARSAEPADPEGLEKWRTLVTKDRGSYISLALRGRGANQDGKLLGMLRAWREPASSAGITDAPEHGIVHEIIIDQQHRGKGYGRQLLAYLQDKVPLAQPGWVGNANRIAANLDRDLNIIKTVFAIFLVEGFKRVVQATYERMLSHDPRLADAKLLSVFAIVLGAIGLRFFFAVGNIRRYVLLRTIALKPPRRPAMVLVHLPLLFLHAVFYFVICRIFEDVTKAELSSTTAAHLLAAFVALLVLNVTWLGLLRRGRSDKGPERTWIWNNLVAIILCMGVFALVKTEVITDPLNYLCWVFGVFAVNSAVDLARASHAYVLRDALGGG